MRRKLCAWLVTLVALACMPAGASAQQTVSLDCCTVLNHMYTYMKVADSYKCTGQDSGCASVKLIQLFVNHSRSSPHGIDMRAQGAEILVTMPSGSTLEDLLVFAFFGRAAAPSASTEVDLWLTYDTKHDKIVFEDSACNYNRNVYTLLVLSSIVLLMFFVGVQVVKNDAAEQKMAAIEEQLSSQPQQQPVATAVTPGLRFRSMHPMSGVDMRLF